MPKRARLNVAHLLPAGMREMLGLLDDESQGCGDRALPLRQLVGQRTPRTRLGPIPRRSVRPVASRCPICLHPTRHFQSFFRAH